MNGGSKPLLCWDSCVFIAWFNKEQDKPLAEIERTLRDIRDSKINLLVSAVSYAEVLDKAGKSEAGTLFRGFVRGPNIVIANVDPRVGLIAAELRSRALMLHEAGELAQGIKIPDTLIAATAMLYRAAELHTFDPILLALSERPEVENLKIVTPSDAGVTPLGF